MLEEKKGRAFVGDEDAAAGVVKADHVALDGHDPEAMSATGWILATGDRSSGSTPRLDLYKGLRQPLEWFRLLRKSNRCALVVRRKCRNYSRVAITGANS